MLNYTWHGCLLIISYAHIFSVCYVVLFFFFSFLFVLCVRTDSMVYFTFQNLIKKKKMKRRFVQTNWIIEQITFKAFYFLFKIQHRSDLEYIGSKVYVWVCNSQETLNCNQPFLTMSTKKLKIHCTVGCMLLFLLLLFSFSVIKEG